MMYDLPCPDPGDKDGWKQWNRCHLVAAAVALIVLGVIFILSKL